MQEIIRDVDRYNLEYPFYCDFCNIIILIIQKVNK